VAKKIMENGILIKNKAAEEWSMQMVTLIGVNSRMITEKDMEHMNMLMEIDTSDNS
jgi:hypothetical protein